MLRVIKNSFHGLLAFLAAAYFGFPANKITVIGVTGTDGKTTTTHLIHHILTYAGKKAAFISSIYAQIGNTMYETGFHVTTPNPWTVQKLLKQAVDAGQEYMVLEVTSHGIDQNRIAGIDFYISVLTNVTHEHLDYHKSYAVYLKTKLALLQKSQVAIVNREDKSYSQLHLKNTVHLVTYGMRKNADVNPVTFSFTTSLPGEYNRYNCLAAIAVTRHLGVPDDKIKSALKTFKGVKGRFERISNKRNLTIIIDFAHTPNALEKILSTVKAETKGNLIHVFGAAGQRDYLKRPLMGKISASYAQYIVLTEEDYRTENVDEIINSIAKGASVKGASERNHLSDKRVQTSKNPVYYKIPQRDEAIEFAINVLAHPGDTVLLTGKAHETSLCRGTREYPWSEHAAVRQALDKYAKN